MSGPAAIGATLLSQPIRAGSRSLQKGEYLFHRGSPVERLFVVRSGRCRLERTSYDGNPIALAEFGPGEVVADGSLFHPQYGCDCRATTPATLAVYSTDSVIALLGRKPELTRLWLGSLAGQVMELRTQLELRNVKSAQERIMLYLTLHADEQGRYRPQVSLKSIAETLGLTPEVLYRTLAELERSGTIERHTHMIRIIGKGGR
jgi:CRP-like cAMP-binding protein